jgi:drug/metabolite transporter (DMT)-like permease
MSFLNTVYCVVFSLSLAVGQILFKYAAQYNSRLSGNILSKVLQNYILIGAFAWYAASSLFYFYILTRAPLSRVYPFAFLGSGVVPLLGWLLFGEVIGSRFLIGYMLMLAGLGLIMTDR